MGRVLWGISEKTKPHVQKERNIFFITILKAAPRAAQAFFVFFDSETFSNNLALHPWQAALSQRANFAEPGYVGAKEMETALVKAYVSIYI